MINQKMATKQAYYAQLKEIIIIKALDISVDIFDEIDLKGNYLCLIKGLGNEDFFEYLNDNKIQGFKLLQLCWNK